MRPSGSAAVTEPRTTTIRAAEPKNHNDSGFSNQKKNQGDLRLRNQRTKAVLGHRTKNQWQIRRPLRAAPDKSPPHRAVRRSLFSDIFIPAKSRNIFHPRKKCLWCKHFASFIFVGNCIQLRNCAVAGALDLDMVFHHIF